MNPSAAPPNPSGGMTREELLSKVSEWSLGCDNALLSRMRDFSENLTKSSQEITESCDALLNDVDLLEFQVSNITNQFLMLSNTQFVENCVQEFQEYNLKEEKRDEVRVPTKAEKEAALIAKMKEAIRNGVTVQRDREQTRVNSVEDSLTNSTDSSRFSSSVNLAHLIGSSKFFSSRYCGLLSEGRLNPGLSINSRASSATSGSTATEENDRIIFPSDSATLKASYENPQLSNSESSYIPSVVVHEPPPAPIPPLTSYSDYPKVLPTDSGFMSKTVEQSPAALANQPPKPNSIPFQIPPRPPSSASSSSNSLFEDNPAMPNEPSIFDAPKIKTRRRSISPPDIRPPPVMDLSDSEDEFFKPAKSNNASFNSFFGNQAKQLITPIPYTEPPPGPDSQPQFVPQEPVKTQPPHFQHQQNHRPIQSVAESSPYVPKSEVSSPPVVPSSVASVSSSVPQNRATTLSPALSRDSEPSVQQNMNVTAASSPLKPSDVPSQKRAEEKIQPATVNQSVGNKEAGRKIFNPKAESTNKPPPKRTSIFDSSDSDDDLFSNFSSKAVKKNSLFSSTPPKYSSAPSALKGIEPVDRRPPPILDISDDSDEDIFKSIDSSSKAKTNSFLDRLPPQSVKEQLRETFENSNLFSPSSPSIPREREPETNSKPVMSPISKDERSRPISPEVTSTILTEPVFHPDEDPKPNQESSNHISEEPEFEDHNSNHSVPDHNSVEEVPAFKSDSLFKTEVVTTTDVSKSLQSTDIINHIAEPPPLNQYDNDDDEDIFTSHVSPPTENSFKTPPRPTELIQDEKVGKHVEPPPDPVVPPKFKPHHQEKVKSIFESSDSDDDLFSSRVKIKSTPTLREISPQPNHSKPYSDDSRFPTLDRSEIRPPPILDMSDSSSDDDLFRSFSKPRSSASSVSAVPPPSNAPTISASTGTTGPPVAQTSGKSIVEIVNSNVDKAEPPVTTAKSKVPSSLFKPKSNNKKQPSLFESSDSDDDLFSTGKTKPKSSVSVKAMVNQMPPIIAPKAVPVKEPAQAKTKSLFGDSDDENDDLFGNGRKNNKVILPDKGLPDAASDDDNETGRVTLPLPPKSDSPVSRKQGDGNVTSKENRFGAVAKSLESIFSAKNLKLAPSASSTRETSTESVSFEDQISTDNLLHCITRDRPKILHPRRPPSLRRQISRSSPTLLPAHSEELDPFV